MADEILSRDQNRITVLGGITDDSNQYITMLRVDPTTKRLLISATGGGTGTVTSITAGTGLTATATNPITISGTIALSTALAPIASLTGNSLKVLRVNAGETAVEYATVGTGTITGSGSANEITYFTGATAIASLTVATYPSLTELSYVKGVTSAIQTQFTGTVKTDQTVGQTIGVTGARLTKLWATDITVTNAITGGVTGNAGTVTGLTFVSGKTLTVDNILEIAGTDSTKMTFPSTSATIARIDAAQTFTGTQTFSQVICTPNVVSVTSNAGTVPITSRINNFTNSSASAMTITMAVTNAVDGQMSIVRIYDASAATKGITWVNTENSTVIAPTTSNGSTTLPLTVGFQYNGQTSLWRCIASA